MKRLVALLTVLIAAGVSAWMIATRVESPAQAAARAEPPAPEPVVAPLEAGFLNGPVSISTTAEYERAAVVRPPAALTGVVTAPGVAVGQTLSPGSVLLRVNGRPLLALPGAFALYRDIAPGDTGDDVAAIQAGLQAAGHSVGKDRLGVYGPGTQRAVRALYRPTGYSAPEHHELPDKPAAEPPTGATGSAPPATPPGSAPPAGGAQEPAPVPAGPRIVMSEFVMVADLPAVVQAVAAVGTSLTSETDMVTLGAGHVLLTATLPTGSTGALAVGADGTFTDDVGVTANAQVASVVARSDTAETLVTLSPGGAVTPGRSYLVAVTNPAGETGTTLLAPIAAVVTRAGRSYLYARDVGEFREVEVRVTGSVGGTAAVVPVGPAESLEAGTDVRIG